MKNWKTALTKTQWILAGMILLQLILIAVVYRPKTGVFPSGQLISGITSEQIRGLTITDGTGLRIRMEKAGEAWSLPEAGGYPTDATIVEEALEKILAIKTNRMVAQTSSSHQRLEVAEGNFQLRVILDLDNGTSFILYLGSASGAGATHVRASGSDQVYLTGDLASWEVPATASNWIETMYFTLDSEQILGMVVSNRNGTFSFVKDEAGTWDYAERSEGEEFDEEVLRTILNRLLSIRLVTPLGTTPEPAYGMVTPNAQVVFTILDENGAPEEITIDVGAQRTDGDYIIKASNSPYYVQAASFVVQDLTTLDHAGLIKETTTP